MMKAACLMLMASAATSAFAQKMNIEHKGDTTIVKVENPTKYLLLPIQEEKDEAQVLLDTGSKDDTWMDVRLAQNGSDYYVPFALGKGKTATVKILGLKKDALALNLLKLSDTFDTTNTDYYRPSYHFTPLYGWMNDPNGMVYKDGEYHLYFQYNPYGSKWGNMHWGHAVSKDLVHWEHLDPAIARDPVGHIFSGSSVLDKKNTAGFGKNAIIAIYTNNSVNHDEVQCLAYSNDNGRTFTKYEGNPVLTPFDGLKDFRDPKVFWYEKGKCWYMIVSADKEMRLYKSKNLKKWNYVSAFGKGIGQQPCQYECPDFFQLPVNGDKKKMKWVMTMNINPGCWFGGSATEYFVGDFDGKKFTCPDANEVKWLDWGKDHYATVTFSNTGDRVLGITWMSNWQYANLTPFKQNRGANGLPRELKLYEKNKKGESYCKTNNVIKKEKLLLKRNHRLTNIRKNYLNQTISEIVNRKPRFICIEDLNVSGMMKNRHLSKAVQEQGFFWFRKQLEYKCSDKGIQLIVADRFYPSSKLCSCCGNIKKDLKLSDRVYRCACGNIIDRDFQASINLKGYGERFAS